MGKEHDLLEAARKGNLAVVEKILTPKKSGLLESLRRTNPNCQDSSGYTPLHHAVLNGHKEVAEYLVKYEANPNVADSKGSYPLHLASWTGNADIVNILLSTQNIKVNEQNSDGDTALHFSAQYGHTEVVEQLLQKQGRPANRNKSNHSPLDLAALYGRVKTVQLFIKEYPALLEDTVPAHTPLHLASKNGHYHVVKLLIDAGINVNIKSEKGTALHEAALFGKLEVVRLLMSYGIDTTCRNNDQQTALDIVEAHSMASHTSQEIAALIKGEKEPFPEQDEADAIHGAQEMDRSELVKTPYDNLPSPDYQSIHGGSDDESPSSKLGYRNLPPMRTPPQKPARHSTALNAKLFTDVPDRTRTASMPASARNIKTNSERRIDKNKTNGSPGTQPNSALVKLEIVEPLYDEIPSPNKQKESVNRKNDSVLVFTEVPPSSKSSGVKYGATENPQERILSEAGSPPPLLPDRNYYDEEVAGTYANLKKFREEAEAAKSNNSVDQGDYVRPSKLQVSTTHSAASPVECIYELLSDATSGDSSPCGPPKEVSRPITKQSEKTITQSESPLASVGNRRKPPFPLKPVPKRPPDLPLTSSTHEKPVIPNRPGKPIKPTDLQIKGRTDLPLHPAPNPPVMLKDQNKRNSHPLNNNIENGKMKVVSTYVEMKAITPSSPTEYDQPPTPDHPPPSANAASLEIHSKFHAQLLPGMSSEADSPRNSTATDITESSDATSTASDSEAEAIFDPVSTVTSTISSTNDGQVSNPHLSTISEGTEVSMVTSRSDEKKELVIIESAEVIAEASSGFSDKSSDAMSVSTDSSSEVEILRPDGADPFAGLVYGSNRNRSSPQPVNFDLSPMASPEKILSPVELSQDWQSTESLESPDFDQILQKAAEAEETKVTTTTGKSSESGREDSTFLDENKEWQQVSDILSSIGAAMVRESVYSRDLEDKFEKMMAASVKPENVAQWLDKLGLLQYENTFLANGFDDLNFLSGSILEEQDLIDMEVQEKSHRQLVLETAKLLPNFKPIEESTMPSSVDEWLNNLHLSDYTDRFHKMGFSTMERVRHIWEVELANVLQINTLGHRKRILASLSVISSKRRESITTKKVFRPLSFTSSKNFEVDWDLSPLAENNAAGNDSEDKSSQESSSLENINLFKDYSKVKPSNTQHLSTKSSSPQGPSKGPPVPSRYSSRQSKPSAYENVQLDPLANAPFTLDPGRWSEDGLPMRDPKLANSDRKTSWRHSSNKLINNSIDYKASYLGSQLIKELKGTESTREACAKLRKSTRNIEKIPSITLSINYKGVKFIDAQTNVVITEHAIRNISCAAQDPDDLKVFAYITRDDRVKKEYCHVFSVKSNELGAEVILTLGQCFEVAYQKLMKEKSGDLNPLYKSNDINPLYSPQTM